MAIKTVALVGASGLLGPYILRALQLSKSLETTVLIRESSKSTFSETIKTKRIPDDLEPQDALVAALKGQDALVLSFSGSSTKQSLLLIDAAIKAGVKRIIPADWGSCDSSDARSLELIPLYKEKEKVRKYLIEREGQGSGHLSWTSLITGHFFDHGLEGPLLGFDVKGRKALIFDGGDKKWSATTREGIATAARRILELGEDEPETKNRLVFSQGVRTSQNELLQALEKVTGEKFSISHVDSDKYIEEKKQELYKEDGSMNGDIMEELVAVEGIVNGDWSQKQALITDLLGVRTEDVESQVSKALAEHKG